MLIFTLFCFQTVITITGIIIWCLIGRNVNTVGVWNESISCNCKTACTNLWYDETFSSAPFPGGDFHLTRTYKRVLKHLESRNIPFRYALLVLQMTSDGLNLHDY